MLAARAARDILVLMRRPPDTPNAAGHGIEVSPRGDGWAVWRVGRSRTAATYPTQDEATRAARILTQAKGGRLVVRGRDGRSRESYILGREAFEKISAVEGIRIDAGMKRDLREARDRYASADQARRAIAAKYGPAEG